jgi:hypothetical protein
MRTVVQYSVAVEQSAGSSPVDFAACLRRVAPARPFLDSSLQWLPNSLPVVHLHRTRASAQSIGAALRENIAASLNSATRWRRGHSGSECTCSPR